MLLGFRSRWMTRLWCAYCMAAQTSAKRRRRAGTSSFRSAQYSVIGSAVDELHHQVRPAVAGDAAVEQPGDVGMDEAGEDAALGEEPLVQRIVGVARADQLDGDAMFEVGAGPLGEIDRAHAAAADLRDDAVGADARRRAPVRAPARRRRAAAPTRP